MNKYDSIEQENDLVNVICKIAPQRDCNIEVNEILTSMWKNVSASLDEVWKGFTKTNIFVISYTPLHFF